MGYDCKRICYFVSPHGFGHATRAAAVIRALQTLDPNLEVEVVTTAPSGLFDQTVLQPVSYFEYASDVGLVQSTPLQEDLPATMQLLDDLLPFEADTIGGLVERIVVQGCDLILCDIAPLGIAVAREANVPSLLIENFTWDWIYDEYVEEAPEIVRHIRYLAGIFDSADYRVRAEPVCGKRECDMTVAPIFREAKLTQTQVREVLEVPNGPKLVLVTMGGIQADWLPTGELKSCSDVIFVVPTSGDSLEVNDNVVKVPALGDVFHPDLVNAADVVVAKLGYSTVTEVYGAGVPLGYVSRPRFRECTVLERFVREHVPALEIGAGSFEDHSWTSQLYELLRFTKRHPASKNGASEVAEFVAQNIFCP